MAQPPPDGPLWALLFRTGMRRADAIGLQRKHIDLARMRLMIYDGKGGKDAVLPFNDEVAAAVSDLDLLERLEPDDFLWYKHKPKDRRRTDPISTSRYAVWYRDSLAQAGVRYLNPHQTRHTYHQWLRDNGLGLEERQELMRHESPDTTVRQYGRSNFEEIAAKVAAL